MQKNIKSKDNSHLAEVVFVISHLGCGGSQRVVTTLVNAWARQGRSVSVITFTNRNHDFFILDPAVRRIILRRVGVARTFMSAVAEGIRRIFYLRRALREAHDRIIVSFIIHTNIFVILASIGLGMKVIISERNDPSRQSFGWLWNYLRRVFYRHADLVTANSHGVLEIMKAYVPEKKLAFLPNPLELPSKKILFDSISSQPRVLAVGRLTHQKGYDVLLEAFARISSKAPEWRLTIVGDGPLKKTLRIQTERLRISDRIDWHSQTMNPFQHYRSADIFVLPSRYEGMPNTLLEAMGCGLPVIVSNASPGPLEYVEDEVTGLVVAVEDVSALGEALDYLIHNAALRRRLGKAARLRVTECAVPKVLGLWNKVVGLAD